ncbi:MAG: radical SAM protein [Planctomycetes bacterium]|nr:radical SAM protein [Planctomycetota bacterium]
MSPSVYLGVEVGEVCQLSCRHCIYHRDNPANARPPNFVRDSVFAAFEQGFDPLWVSYSGKEPTLFPDRLLELARRTKRPDRVNILMTNGLKLTGDLLLELGKAITLFDISLDGDEEAHDWMRGPGTFGATWRNMEEVLERTDCRVGVIATAVHARLADGRRQIFDLIALARRLQSAFGSGNRISLSISLYYGPPGDPLLLRPQDIAELMSGLEDVAFPTRVLFSANYAHQWTEVRQAIGWTNAQMQFDVGTGLAVMQRAKLMAILFNLTPSDQLGIRVSNEGEVYLGCNHLVLGDDAKTFSLGNLKRDQLEEIARRVVRNETIWGDCLGLLPADCAVCDQWDDCRGGDRLSGVYFDRKPADPYCEILKRGVS